MSPLKNVDKIIQVFSNILSISDDWELIICGAINEQYRQLVTQLNLYSKIKFSGEVSYVQVAQEMQQADALLMFSKHENFPCVIIEALCCGLPVIASNVGGISEAVDETNGILAESDNTVELQNAIISIMNNINNYDFQKIAEEASLKYNYSTIAQQFVDMYKSVLTNHSIK